ncbi:VOC family protein [Sphingomonas sp.]|uniref:VOC family protein n=1 Tax=Sphingomonas sp. TaxID=28214 RepID=UPI002FC856E7
MHSPHGRFIWYELLTTDPDAAAAFYRAVVGWSAQGCGQPGFDYRYFLASDGGAVAGHAALPAVAAEAGMRPAWLGYIGVDDVDSAVDAIAAAGGSVQMAAMDVEHVGRIAMVTDPLGAPFYVMRGAGGQASAAFDQALPGHCHWNELATLDQQAALDFYGAQFGWTKGDSMPMGEMGDYQFIEHDGRTIGAIMTRPPAGPPPSWTFYFGVPDIDAAAAAINDNGGAIMHGPAEIPGGGFIIVASDPQGAGFGLVGPRAE